MTTSQALNPKVPRNLAGSHLELHRRPARTKVKIATTLILVQDLVLWRNLAHVLPPRCHRLNHLVAHLVGTQAQHQQYSHLLLPRIDGDPTRKWHIPTLKIYPLHLCPLLQDHPYHLLHLHANQAGNSNTIILIINIGCQLSACLYLRVLLLDRVFDGHILVIRTLIACVSPGLIVDLRTRR